MRLKQSLCPRVDSGVSARICFSASRIKSALRCLDLPRDHDDMLPLLPRLCRQTTTMYGRPEGSASSCLRAFDNSIIPTRSDRSISVSKSFSAQFFFSVRFIEPRKFLKDLRAIAQLRLHLAVVKKRGSRAPHTGVTISNSFSPRPVDFTHRKWNARLGMTACLFLIVTFHARSD